MRFEHTVRIARPPEDVFDYLTDVENLPRWQGTLTAVRLDGGRIRETRSFLGKRVESLVEVVASERPSRWEIRTVEGPARFRVLHELDPSGEGATRLAVVGEGDVGALGRLAAPMVKRAVQRQAQEDFARLKRLLEADPH